ncbi:hypothetical protein BS78_02G211900 [Paspalum vaginatum]|nr:hypothetical protein BS78_02G211900 [Paspalum vaginatum]
MGPEIPISVSSAEKAENRIPCIRSRRRLLSTRRLLLAKPRTALCGSCQLWSCKEKVASLFGPSLSVGSSRSSKRTAFGAGLFFLQVRGGRAGRLLCTCTCIVPVRCVDREASVLEAGLRAQQPTQAPTPTHPWVSFHAADRDQSGAWQKRLIVSENLSSLALQGLYCSANLECNPHANATQRRVWHLLRFWTWSVGPTCRAALRYGGPWLRKCAACVELELVM